MGTAPPDPPFPLLSPLSSSSLVPSPSLPSNRTTMDVVTIAPNTSEIAEPLQPAPSPVKARRVSNKEGALQPKSANKMANRFGFTRKAAAGGRPLRWPRRRQRRLTS